MNDWHPFRLWKSFMKPNRLRRCPKICDFALTVSLAAVSIPLAHSSTMFNLLYSVRCSECQRDRLITQTNPVTINPKHFPPLVTIVRDNDVLQCFLLFCGFKMAFRERNSHSDAMSSGHSGSFNLRNTQTHMDMYDCYLNITLLLWLDFIAVIFNEFAENYAF